MTPEEFLAGHALASAAYARVCAILEQRVKFGVHVSRSQIAFRRRRGFAWLWLPGQFLARPQAEVVLSIALGRRDSSPRWKEVVQPADRHWMHHLELRALRDIDDEVEAWLAEAAARAG